MAKPNTCLSLAEARRLFSYSPETGELLSTQSQNQANKGPFKNNKSGLKGVYRHFKNDCWYSTIRKNKKTTYLGVFDCPVAAHLAFVVAANKAHGEFARSTW